MKTLCGLQLDKGKKLQGALRILHVIRGLSNSSGVTHIVNPLAEEQGRVGHQVRVAYVQKPRSRAVEPDRTLSEAYAYPMTIPLNNPGLSFGFARSIARHVAWSDIVHVHSVWNFPTWWSMREALRQGKPYVVSPQGSFDPWALQQNSVGKRLYGALTELPLIMAAAAMQALTTKEEHQFRSAGFRNKVCVIPNGVHMELLQYSRQPGALARKLGLPPGSKTLLYLSRIHEKKGLDLLLRAFASVKKSLKDVYLVVAGGDAGTGYSDRLKSLANDLGISADCRFLGEVSGESKRDCLMGADGWALISHSEGLPVAALEAMGAGLPTIISDECNIPEVAHYDAGWIVKPNSQCAGRALVELFNEPALSARRSINARDMIASKFTWPRISRQVLDWYLEVLNEPPRTMAASRER